MRSKTELYKCFQWHKTPADEEKIGALLLNSSDLLARGRIIFIRFFISYLLGNI